MHRVLVVNPDNTLLSADRTCALSPCSSSSGITRSLLGTGSNSCLNLGTLFFLSAAPFALPRRCSETLSAGEEAGSALRAVDGVDGDDF